MAPIRRVLMICCTLGLLHTTLVTPAGNTGCIPHRASTCLLLAAAVPMYRRHEAADQAAGSGRQML
jgi:hypothetical protein